MKRGPIYIADSELYLKLGKTILLLNQLSFNNKKEPILTLEKIALFEFLTKHPTLINQLLHKKNSLIIDLNNSEIFSIEALFPDKGFLYDFTSIKHLLNILIAHEMVNISTTKNFEINYFITDKGIEFANSLKTEYFERISRILVKLAPINTQTFSKINSLIKPYLTYGIKD